MYGMPICTRGGVGQFESSQQRCGRLLQVDRRGAPLRLERGTEPWDCSPAEGGLSIDARCVTWQSRTTTQAVGEGRSIENGAQCPRPYASDCCTIECNWAPLKRASERAAEGRRADSGSADIAARGGDIGETHRMRPGERFGWASMGAQAACAQLQRSARGRRALRRARLACPIRQWRRLRM
jgi:hypothetical protein